MIKYICDLLKAMRPAFSRKATFNWFVLVFIGFIMRNDIFGVSSIVRALCLNPTCYVCLLHFFHSTAWKTNNLLECWWLWVVKEKVVYRVNEHIVLVGDHTMTPKDGRRIPEINTLHQDSETASKPTFFRGHKWAFIGILVNASKKFFATPLWSEIHQNPLKYSQTTRIVTSAGYIAKVMKKNAYLVLDAFFAVGTVFNIAAKQESTLHILTRAKKNVVAYFSPIKPKKPQRGRPRIYGKKLKLIESFDNLAHKFKTAETIVYNKQEKVRYLTLNLIWKPIQKKIRFFLIETSRGKIILMSSDLTLEPIVALNLYCKRITIETMFDMFKNLLGGMGYHFWSKYLKPVSRRPLKNKKIKPISTKPIKTKNTLNAIEKFNYIQLIVLGTLQLLSCKFNKQICRKARCWLRTSCGDVPSEFVTRYAISNIIRQNLFIIGKDWITQLILGKQKNKKYTVQSRKVA